jgi:hypothetical protein
MNPTIDIDRAFYHFERRKVYEDSIISLHGTSYEAPSILMGKKVDVFFDPHPPIHSIIVKSEGKEFTDVRPVDLVANTKIKRNCNTNKEIEILIDQDDETTVNPACFSAINTVREESSL